MSYAATTWRSVAANEALTVTGTGANIHAWISNPKYSSLRFAASGVLLAGASAWVYFYRRADASGLARNRGVRAVL